VAGMQRLRALVIGSSIGGLLAARVLADHFADVTIVERDRLPTDGPTHRTGVPQSHHLHILLMRGQAIFEQLLPGLRDELLAAGAPRIDSARDLLWRNPAGWAVRYPSGLTKLAFSRDLLDWHVRQRLAAWPSIHTLDGVAVHGLASNGQRVTGVQTSDGVLEADFVVDASGRGSRTPHWLHQLGYAKPEERIVDAHLGYASRLYAKPAGVADDWLAVYVQAAPPTRNRGGVIFSVEGNRWLVTLVGSAAEAPPTSESGFLEFARALPTPLLYDAMRAGSPLTDIIATRSGENRLRLYDKLSRWPNGLVVIGDAACAFNPVYGQGMTVAALEALALSECLRRSAADIGRTFQRQQAKIVALPWALATGEDARYPRTDGAVIDLKTGFLHRYMDHVLALATERQSVRGAMLQVQHMLQPPSALFAPNVLLPVLGRTLGHHGSRLTGQGRGDHRLQSRPGQGLGSGARS
jgi:2-polyprenyl-6-methoxyphenol hydroxylase-like FAD-dependent oxidoreductase